MAMTKIKTSATLRNERDELNATLIGWEAGLKQLADPTSEDALTIRGKINIIKENLEATKKSGLPFF